MIKRIYFWGKRRFRKWRIYFWEKEGIENDGENILSGKRR